MKQNWSVYVKAAYVASHSRVLTLKYHEIGTLLWELGTLLHRGRAGNHRETRLHPECDWLCTSRPDQPHVCMDPEHVEGVPPEVHHLCWGHESATARQQEEKLSSLKTISDSWQCLWKREPQRQRCWSDLGTVGNVSRSCTWHCPMFLIHYFT